MDEAVRLTLVLGTVALCAIVGIYYVGVRRRSEPEQPLENRLPEIPSQPAGK
jgi:hypothetical protein